MTEFQIRYKREVVGVVEDKAIIRAENEREAILKLEKQFEEEETTSWIEIQGVETIKYNDPNQLLFPFKELESQS